MEDESREGARRLLEDTLEEVRRTLQPLVETTLRLELGPHWRQRALAAYRRRLRQDASESSLTDDVSAMLPLISQVYWKKNFEVVWPGCRSWVEIIRNIRHLITHRQAPLNSTEFILLVHLAVEQFLSKARMDCSDVKLRKDQFLIRGGLTRARDFLNKHAEAENVESESGNRWLSRTVSDEIEQMIQNGYYWSEDYVNCPQCDHGMFSNEDPMRIGQTVSCEYCRATFSVELKMRDRGLLEDKETS